MKKTMPRRLGALLLALALTLTLVTVPAAAADAVTVTLNKTTLTLEQGKTETLTVGVTVNGTVLTVATVIWSSDDPMVVTVSDGVLTAVSVGTATVTATYTDPADATKTASATCAVTVTAPPVPITGLVMATGTELSLSVGSTAALSLTVTPNNATEQPEWTVVDATSAGMLTMTVGTGGSGCTILANAPGTATVRATAKNGAKADCLVTVSGLVLDATRLTLIEGESKSLSVASYGKAPAPASITWSSSNISVAEVIDGRITAYYPGTATITASAGSYSATCVVTVEEDAADVIEVSAGAGAQLSFSGLVSTLNSRCYDKTGASLQYVSSMQVSPDQGVLYYGYASADNTGSGVGNESYYVSPATGQLALHQVSFLSNTDFSGTAVISYTGRATNSRSFSGTIRVTVAASSDVRYSTTANQAVHFDPADFSAACLARTGKDFTSISFAPPSAKKGTLYYNYSAANAYNPEVEVGMSFYPARTPGLDTVVFVPEGDYSGSVEITYYCTTTSGTHTGKVTIQVSAVSQSYAGRITYDVTSGGTVDLDDDDFNRVSRDTTGSSLSYVYFDLPDAAAGTLYYGYSTWSSSGSRVSASTRYFRSSSPRISSVSFVAAQAFSGTVTIPFTGYSIGGDRFSGELVIRVGSYDGAVSYRSSYGESIRFDDADFNELSLSLTGKSIRYVSFEQPASSRGTLYRGTTYNSSTKVKSSNKFYRSGGSYQIDDVIFVPNSGYTGTFDIPFTGSDVSGNSLKGVVQITVDRQLGSAVVSYQTVSGGTALFSAEDFNLACQLRTGEKLKYVQFRLPASSEGKLYYSYNTTSDTGTNVYASTSYYRTGGTRLLDNVTFRAADDYTGVLTLQYTGVSTDGTSYSGTVEITVLSAGSAEVSYTGSSLPIQLRAADFDSACVQRTGRRLSYLYFTSLPEESMGKLYWNYASPMRRGTAVQTGTGSSYYVTGSPNIDQLTFVPRAGYQGYVTIPYVGVDAAGRGFSGTLSFYLADQYSPKSFTDLDGYDTEKASIAYLYDCGVVNGYGNGVYKPGGSISRGEFTVMIYRAFELADGGSSYSFSDVAADSYYAPAVAAAKRAGLVQGYDGKFRPQDTITREDAMTILLRAVQAKGLAVPGASTSVLAAYSDGDQVSTYARTAVSTFVYLGVADAGYTRQLRPKQALTRAEMAVLLHYILTQ